MLPVAVSLQDEMFPTAAEEGRRWIFGRIVLALKDGATQVRFRYHPDHDAWSIHYNPEPAEAWQEMVPFPGFVPVARGLGQLARSGLGKARWWHGLALLVARCLTAPPECPVQLWIRGEPAEIGIPWGVALGRRAGAREITVALRAGAAARQATRALVSEHRHRAEGQAMMQKSEAPPP
jgi:hypothetical protein